MSWDLDAEHRDFQAVCRTFVDRHVRSAIGEAETLGRVPQRLLAHGWAFVTAA